MPMPPPHRPPASPSPSRHACAPALLAAAATYAAAAVACALACGCGKESVARPPSAAAYPIELVVADPAAEVAARVVPPAALARGEDAGAGDPLASDAGAEAAQLPAAWSPPAIPKLAFADALARARAARAELFRRGAAPASPAPPASSASSASSASPASPASPSRSASPAAASPAAASPDDAKRTWFLHAHAAADRASRMFAAAFHAADAPRDGRIEAIAEAAELDLAMSRVLDDAGLGTMPAAWRTDPALASTFEDVAVGPTRRWRDEARALARQCVDTARATGVETAAARRCAELRTGVSARTARRLDAGPGGYAACACAPGDPLCSASLGGWCPP